MKNLKIIISCLTQEESSKVAKFTFVMVIISILEFISLGSLFPLISLLSKNRFYESNIATFHNASTIFLALVLLLIFSILLKNILSSFFYYKLFNFSQNLRSRVSNFLFKSYIYDNYEKHLKVKSGDLIRNITSLPTTFQNSVFSSILILQEFIVFFGLIILLLIINFEFTIFSLIIFFVLFTLFKFLFKKKLTFYGNEILKNQALFSKFLYFSMTCIRDIKIFQAENYFKDNYFNFYNKFSETHAKNQFLNVLPRILIEFFLVVLLLILLVFLFFKDIDLKNLLASIAVFVAVIARMIPGISKILNMYNVLIYSLPSNQILQNFLINFNKDIFQDELSDYKFKDLSKDDIIIEFKNINFSFNKKSKNYILKNLNFSLKKNSIMGILGKSGSGKTTILNILCGIIGPDSGVVSYYGDDISKNYNLWRSKIGYVPQYVNLFDGTVINNLVFKEEYKNIDFVQKKLDDVNLLNFVENLPQSLNTKLGENGSNLSGGQRQRLGIARALIKNPEILIMDEATNSLDKKNEDQILELLEKLKTNMTIILVSHDKEVMKVCDKTINLDK